MKILGWSSWIAVGACLALMSCREDIDEGPTKEEIVAKLKAKKLREAEEKERARKASVEKLMAKMRDEEEAASAREAEAPSPDTEMNEAAELAQSRAAEQADRREQLKKIRGTIIKLKTKREAVDERISEHSVKLEAAEEAAEIARYGDPASRIRLAGSDTRKTAAADAEVKKIKAQIGKLQKSYDEFTEAIAAQKAEINRL